MFNFSSKNFFLTFLSFKKSQKYYYLHGKQQGHDKTIMKEHDFKT